MTQSESIILRAYLASITDLTDEVETRIYSPRLPKNHKLPAVSFFVRGGTATPYIPSYVSPSFQFDCWADDPLVSRSIFNIIYDDLQGMENKIVDVGGTNYTIVSAIEETRGQDLQSIDYPNYFRTLGFFSIIMKI